MKAGTVNDKFVWARDYTPIEGDILTCKSCGKELKFIAGGKVSPYFKHKLAEAGTCKYAQGTEWVDDGGEEVVFNEAILIDILDNFKMPFGKYKGLKSAAFNTDEHLQYCDWLYKTKYKVLDTKSISNNFGLDKVKILLLSIVDIEIVKKLYT